MQRKIANRNKHKCISCPDCEREKRERQLTPCGFCNTCKTTMGDDGSCELSMLRETQKARKQRLEPGWHAYPGVCQRPGDCDVCACDCDHCCFGMGLACSDSGIFKTSRYRSKNKLKYVNKRDIKLSKREIRYLALFFRLSKNPCKYLDILVAFGREFPFFETLSDDDGITARQIFRCNVEDQADDMFNHVFPRAAEAVTSRKRLDTIM